MSARRCPTPSAAYCISKIGFPESWLSQSILSRACPRPPFSQPDFKSSRYAVRPSYSAPCGTREIFASARVCSPRTFARGFSISYPTYPSQIRTLTAARAEPALALMRSETLP